VEGDVENDSVVPPVEVVPVRGPVAGMDMEFDVAAEENGTNADEGIDEIRSAVVVRRAGSVDGNRLSVLGAEPEGAVQPVFPEMPEVAL